MKCRLKNKFSGFITELDDFKEYPDCFEKSQDVNDVFHNFVYPKCKWEKIFTKDEMLSFILKDINKIHMFGFSDIKEIYNYTDMIIFRLYSSDIRTASLSYVKETKEIYFECCKIESDDLKASIKSYLSLLNKE